MSDKVVEFPVKGTRKQNFGFIEVSYDVDPEDMDAAIFCLSSTAIGLSAGANIDHKSIMHGALVVAAQAALTAGFSQGEFRYITSTIEFLDEPPTDVS
jgi:hypothetical protein